MTAGIWCSDWACLLGSTLNHKIFFPKSQEARLSSLRVRAEARLSSLRVSLGLGIGLDLLFCDDSQWRHRVRFVIERTAQQTDPLRLCSRMHSAQSSLYGFVILGITQK